MRDNDKRSARRQSQHRRSATMQTNQRHGIPYIAIVVGDVGKTITIALRCH